MSNKALKVAILGAEVVNKTKSDGELLSPIHTEYRKLMEYIPETALDRR